MASSSTTIPAFKYDVFISFRGEDTRKGFTSHLHTALQQKKIKTYRDDEDLKRGDEISQALKEAIETSKHYVIIFSENYASSSWCLDELVHILECREKHKQVVLPVFYCVDPSDVRQRKGSYGSAFEKHEKRFGNDMDKVKKWRGALRAAANLAGWDSQVIRDESNLVEMIVKAILGGMNRAPSSDDFKGLVGITKRTAQIKSLLCTGSSVDIRKIGIWGIGGIGKTTLARLVFNQFSDEFESSCFLENVREEWGRGHKHALKKKLFSELLKEKNPNMGTLSVGSTYDKVRLCRKKVLIVLDDMDVSKQLDFLTENCIWFGPGSRIIVTTRDMQVLRGEVDGIYKVERLNHHEALQLFQSKAFKRTPLGKDLLHISERVENYSEGIPLALEVLGSFLRGKKPENWKEELNKLKECPHPEVQSLLRISYDGLDRKQKCIFLDIACFFKGVHRDFVERILDACGLFAKSGIDDLIDKSLITIKDDSILWMHDLVQEMGREIEKSSEELPRRQRLWNAEEVSTVLASNIGTATIEGMVLDMSNIGEVQFNPAAFQNMYKLRLLKIFCSNENKKCEVRIPRGDYDLQFLPNSLRFLHWEDYPWESIPSSFSPQHLVELNLPYSKVSKLWEGNHQLGSLKKIDLSYSENLTRLPNLSQASKLEHVYLENCTSLRQVPSYFEHLQELKTLILEGCSSIHKFPKVAKSVVCLVLSRTAIERVPTSIEHLSCLEILILDDCKKLKSLPNYISKPKSLKAVTFSGTPVPTSNPNNFPFWIGEVIRSSQWSLYQDYRNVQTRFRLHHLPKLKSLPELPLFWNFDDDGDAYVELASATIERLRLRNPGLCQENVSDLVEALFIPNSNTHQEPSHTDFDLSAGRNFLFYNCLPLYGMGCNEEIKSVRMLKFLCKKIALQEFKMKLPVETDIGVFGPGKEIPNWFHYQFSLNADVSCQRARVTIELPPNSLNANFLGFAVCVSVFDTPARPFHGGTVALACRHRFIMHNGSSFPWDFYHDHSKLPDYPNRTLFEAVCSVREMITKVEFEFFLVTATLDFLSCPMNKCGIHLLYAEDADIFGVLPEEEEDYETEEEEKIEEEEKKRRRRREEEDRSVCNEARRRRQTTRVLHYSSISKGTTESNFIEESLLSKTKMKKEKRKKKFVSSHGFRKYCPWRHILSI